MGFEPVVAKAGIGNEGDSHLEGVLHFFNDDMFYTFFFFGENGEVEFVVNLENHLALDAFGLETLVDVNHSYLDDISCCALNGGIDGVTFSETTHDAVGRVDVWQVATTSKQGSDVALFSGYLLGLLHVVVNLWEGLEVTVYQHLSFVARDIQALCETKDGDAIDDTKIGSF